MFITIPLRLILIFYGYVFLTIGILAVKHLSDYMLSFIFSITAVFLVFTLIRGKYLLGICLYVYALVLGMELASIYNAGQLVDTMTLANLTEVSAVSKSVVCSSIFILLILFLMNALISNKFVFRLHLSFYLLCIPLCLFYIKYDPVRPLTDFYSSVRSYLKQIYFHPDLDKIKEQMDLYGKDWIYKTADNKEVPNLKNKNVIVFFTESLSLNMIDKFNNYSGLTPNISNFADKSIFVDNYFNHTAATYRGIRGQLGSSYQLAGGWRTDYPSGRLDTDVTEQKNIKMSKLILMPEILNNNGYHSYFLSADSSSSYFNKYLVTMGFEKIFSAEDMNTEKSIVSDDELFAGLKKLLKSGELQEPYFIGVYNLGTHTPAWKLTDIVYENDIYPNNQNLNNIYAFDKNFGDFIKFILSDTELVEKSAVILTADHACSYLSENKIFGISRDHFMDKIPLVLWYKGVKPSFLDAGNKNSLDFAPTLLHWLRISKAKNYFLGCSLYDSECQSSLQYIFNDGDIFYSSYPYKQLHPYVEEDKKIINKIKDYYHLSTPNLSADSSVYLIW